MVVSTGRRTRLLVLFACAPACSAFVPITHPLARHNRRAVPSVLAAPSASPVPIADSDLLEQDKISPPSTFFECTLQAYTASAAALRDGHKLLEVEFPPLSAQQMADQSVSANSITAANVELAVDYAQYFAREGKRVAVLVPDYEELENLEEWYGKDEPGENITIHSVRQRQSETVETFTDIFMGIFSRAVGKVQKVSRADMYVSIIFSGQELPDLEKLHAMEPEKPIVFFNLNLETHRGDLGLPAFPSKDLHYRFLSQIKPVYLLRTRQYSMTLSKPPFLLNYQGALFRVYPGGYQCLLDTGSRYRRVDTLRARPALSEFKEVITLALNVDDNKTLQKLRKGAVVQKTWWEKEESFDKASSDSWRT